MVSRLSPTALRLVVSPIGQNQTFRALQYCSLQLLKRSPSQNKMSHQSINSGPNDLSKVYVQNNCSKKIMTISFEYSEADKKRNFNLFRKSDEPLSASLERIKLNLRKIRGRPKNKKPDSDTELSNDVIIEFISNSGSVNLDKITNSEAWVDGSILKMNGKSYQVRTDYPQVETLAITAHPIEGFLILPNVSLKNCVIDDCQFIWYRQIQSQDKKTLVEADPNIADTILFDGRQYWLKLAESLTYTPTSDDVNCLIKVICLPSDRKRVGPMFEYMSPNRVQINKLKFPFEERHRYTSEVITEPNEFRVVSYNILADVYADQDYSRTVLFKHCPSHALEIDYRRQLLLKEISGYKADIICMQEVDRKEYIRTYEPFMRLVADHSGVMNTKGGQVPEGVATFFRNDKFDLLHTHVTVLSDIIQRVQGETSGGDTNGEVSEIAEPNPITSHPFLKDRDSPQAIDLLSRFNEMRKSVMANPLLAKRLLERHTVLQASLIKSKQCPNQYIIVGNTHLYFAPDADHVRLLQGSICVKYLEYLKEEFYGKMVVSDSDQTTPNLSVILAGDMNSVPECGLFQLATKGYVSSDSVDWKSNQEEEVVGLSLNTNLRFKSAYNDVAYTNYTPDFNGCLDYIYYEQSNLTCESAVPLPSHEDITLTGGIPSDVFPSDHIALVANLKFSSTSVANER